MKVILLFFLLSTASFANSEYFKCQLPNKVMLSILLNEQTNKRDLDYPFIISHNYVKKTKPTAFKKVTQIFNENKNIPINPYVYDCKNLVQCKKTIFDLKKEGFENFDLGPFQINYYYHKYDLDYMFSFNGSYLIACRYLSELIMKYGYSLNTLAFYHSRTEVYKNKYLGKLTEKIDYVNKALND